MARLSCGTFARPACCSRAVRHVMPSLRTLIITIAMLLTSAGTHGQGCLYQDIDAASRVRRDAALAYVSAMNSGVVILAMLVKNHL